MPWLRRKWRIEDGYTTEQKLWIIGEQAQSARQSSVDTANMVLELTWWLIEKLYKEGETLWCLHTLSGCACDKGLTRWKWPSSTATNENGSSQQWFAPPTYCILNLICRACRIIISEIAKRTQWAITHSFSLNYLCCSTMQVWLYIINFNLRPTDWLIASSQIII